MGENDNPEQPTDDGATDDTSDDTGSVLLPPRADAVEKGRKTEGADSIEVREGD